jgi:hypothetical protein
LGEATQATKADIWPYSGIANPISQSLRFRASASAHLSKTWGSNGSSQTFTVSTWVKRGALGAIRAIVTARQDGNNNLSFRFIANDTLEVYAFSGGSLVTNLITTQVFRDPSAWYHLVLAVDTTQATSSNRVKFYVNGTQITAFGTATYPSLNATTLWNQTAATHYLGTYDASSEFFDGYMAEVNVIGGQQLDPSSFGQTSAITGVWESKQYTGTYGTNGFRLEFKDTTVGQDTSGNNNDWTPNNISTTLGSTLDLVEDVPTQWSPRGTTDVGGVIRGNYCTFNPLDRNYFTTQTAPLDANMRLYGLGGCRTNFGITTGKWYAEFTLSGGGTPSANFPCIGLRAAADDGYWCGYASNSVGYQQGGTVYYNGNTVAQATGQSFTTGDVLGLAYDADTNRVWFAKNGTWIGTGSPNPATNTSPVYTFSSSAERFIAGDSIDTSYGGLAFNAGQRPFVYTPPSGFKSLCTTNLPTPTIGATAANAASKYFNTVLYTGNGAASRPITGVGFQPDMVWTKRRSTSDNHHLFDSVRVVSSVPQRLFPNLTNVEDGNFGSLDSFDTDGFTVGSNVGTNANGETFVGWSWKAGNSTVTNTTGSISSQVRANPTTGFSILTYTGNGTGGATVGHGLGVAPSMMIFKTRAETGVWLVWHTGYGSNQAQTLLNTNAAIFNPGNGLYFNSTFPSSTVATLGTSGATNGNGTTYVAYMFAPVAGFSAFGSYTGNGSSNGPFVYTGFRPRFIIVKRTDASDNWMIMDTSINPINVASTHLRSDSTSAELNPGGSPAVSFDFLSNGFKNRESNNQVNNSGGTYIYMAFAENPFKNSLAR